MMNLIVPRDGINDDNDDENGEVNKDLKAPKEERSQSNFITIWMVFIIV